MVLKGPLLGDTREDPAVSFWSPGNRASHHSLMKQSFGSIHSFRDNMVLKR